MQLFSTWLSHPSERNSLLLYISKLSYDKVGLELKMEVYCGVEQHRQIRGEEDKKGSSSLGMIALILRADCVLVHRDKSEI